MAPPEASIAACGGGEAAGLDLLASPGTQADTWTRQDARQVHEAASQPHGPARMQGRSMRLAGRHTDLPGCLAGP